MSQVRTETPGAISVLGRSNNLVSRPESSTSDSLGAGRAADELPRWRHCMGLEECRQYRPLIESDLPYESVKRFFCNP